MRIALGQKPQKFPVAKKILFYSPVDNFGTVVGENPTLIWNFSIVGCQWTVNCLLGPYSRCLAVDQHLDCLQWTPSDDGGKIIACISRKVHYRPWKKHSSVDTQWQTSTRRPNWWKSHLPCIVQSPFLRDSLFIQHIICSIERLGIPQGVCTIAGSTFLRHPHNGQINLFRIPHNNRRSSLPRQPHIMEIIIALPVMVNRLRPMNSAEPGDATHAQ